MSNDKFPAGMAVGIGLSIGVFLILMFGFSLGEDSIKKEISKYGCEAVLKEEALKK